MEEQQQFLKENPDLLLISVVDKSGDTCDNRMYIYNIIYLLNRLDLGSFPNQRIIPYIAYILTHHNSDVMLLTSEKTSETDLNMLEDTIISLGGFIKRHVVVNESDFTTLEDKITDYFSSFKLYIPDGGVFLNYLQNENSYKIVFAKYQVIMKNFFQFAEDAGKLFPVFSWDINILNSIDTSQSVGQFSLASCYTDQNTATKIYNMGINMFGNTYSIPKVETRSIIAYELLVDEYTKTEDFSNKGIYDYLNNNVLTTSFGQTNMSSTDTSIPFPYVVLIKNRNGYTSVVSQVSINWEAEAYRHNFNRQKYRICSKFEGSTGAEVEYNSIRFYFLISFSGTFSYSSSALLLSYLAAIDFVNDNYNGIHNKKIIPIIQNVESDNEIAKSFILKAVNDTGNRVIFGLSNSVMRKYVLDDLNENELLLFYPYAFEGYECSENVIYTRTPFSEQITAISYFYLSKNSFDDVLILYSDTLKDYQNAQNIQYYLSVRGIEVKSMIRLPTSSYKMSVVMNIIVSNMKSGLIISLLEGSAANDFFLQLNESNYDSSTYTVLSFNTKLTEITDDNYWKLFDGHYFVETRSKKLFKNQEIYNIAKNKYTFIDKEPSSSGILSVLIASKALNSINFNENTNEEENFVPYSFKDLLNAVHNTDVSDIIDSTRITTNNQISLYIDLVQVHYYEANNSHALEIITNLNEGDNINPYATQFNNDGNMYYCEWKVDDNILRGDKLKRESKKIALLYSITGNNKKYELNAMDIMTVTLKNLNRLNVLNNTYLDFIVFDTSSTDSLKTIAQTIVKNTDIVMIIGCSSIDCKNGINDELVRLKSNKKLWYPGLFEGQECDRNIYYTGLLPSLFTKPLSTFLDQAESEKSIYFLGINAKTNKMIHEILIKAYDQLYTIIGNDLVESGKGTTYDYATKLVETYVEEGCIIILTLDDETGVDFINYFDTLVTDEYTKLLLSEKTKFNIICLTNDREILNSLTISEHLNVYLTGSYFNEINTDCQFRQVITDYFGERINGNELSHSSFLAISYWATAVNRVGHFNNDELLANQLYKSSVQGCDGITMMFTDNHISLPFFVMQIKRDKNSNYILSNAYSQTRILEPLAYSWDIEQTNGLICDFTDSSVDSGAVVPTITIAVALSISGKYRDTDKYVMNVFELVLDSLNTNNGLLNKRITVQSYDIESSDTICYELLSNYLKLVNEGVIFTSATDGCISNLSPLLIEKDILLFQIGYVGGEKCYQNVFYMLKEPSYVGRIFDYMIEPTMPETLHYCVLTTNDDTGNKYNTYINSYMQFVGGTIDYSSNSLALSEDGNDDVISSVIEDIVKGLISATPEYGCYIIFVGDSVLHYQIDKSLDKYSKEYNYDRKKYRIVSLTTASNAAVRGVKQFYSVQTYFTDLDNELNIQMKNDILSVTNFVTEVMYTAYISSHIFINAVESGKSINATILRKQLYNLNYESPSGGTLAIGDNNYINQYMIFGLMKENDPEYGFEIVIKSSKPLDSVVYKDWINDAKYICIFNSDKTYDKYRETSITIGILTSYSGKFNTTERSITRGIIEAVDEINAEGGIIGKKITMLVRDAKSDINKYVEYAEEFCRLDEVNVVFGGGAPVVVDAVYSIFETNKKLFFQNGLTTTEACPKYTMSTQITSGQLMKAAWKYLLPNANHLYVIQDDEVFSYQVARGLMLLSSMVRVDTHVYNLSSLNDNYIPDDFDYQNLDKDSIVFLSLSGENNIKALSWLCRLNINATKTYIVTVSLDRYLMEYIPAKCIAGTYILTSFVKEMGLETSDTMTYLSTSKSFIDAMNDRYGDIAIVTSATECGYISVTLWSNIITSYTKSFDNSKIRNSLYGYTTTGPSGTIEMSVDGYANRIVYMVKIASDKTLSVVDYAATPVGADAWNDIFPENEGYVCDWTVDSSTTTSTRRRTSRQLADNYERYRRNSLKLVFFHDTTEARSVEINSMLMEYALIDEINTNGGINDYLLIPEFVFAGSVEEFGNLTSSYIDDKEVVSFFGCTTDACKTNAQSIADKTGKQWVSYSLTYGESCSGNHMEVGSTISQKFLSTELYLHNNIPDLSMLIFVGDDSKLMDEYYKVIYYYVRDHYKENKHTILRLTIDSSRVDSSINDAMRDIQTKKDEYERVALLYFLEGETNQKFLSKYISNGLNSREVLIIILNYLESDYTSEILSNIYGSYIVTSFSSSISTSFAQSFVSTSQSSIGIKKEIDEKIEAIKDSIMLWQQVYEKAVEDSNQIIPPIRYFQLSSVGSEIKAPSGNIKVEESLYISRNFYIFEINRNAKHIQVFPTRGSEYIFTAQPYPSGLPSECKFGKTQVFHQYNTVILSIAYILFAISIIMSIISLIFVKLHDKQIVIKTLGRAHNYCLIISLIILSFSSIPIYQYPSSSNGICVFRVILLSLGVKSLLGIMLATETKLFKKNQRKQLTIKKTKISIKRVLFFWSCLVSLQVIILLLWFLIDPNEYMTATIASESDYFSDVNARECTISTPFVIIELVTDFLPSLFLLILSNSTRNLANEFHDTLGLYISSIVIIVLGAIMVLLDFNINTDPDSVLLLRGMGINLTVIIIVILQYGIKIGNVYFDEEAKNVTSSGSAGSIGGGTSFGVSGRTTSETGSRKTLSSMIFASSSKTKTFTTQSKIISKLNQYNTANNHNNNNSNAV